jgi:hypothetical protein
MFLSSNEQISEALRNYFIGQESNYNTTTETKHAFVQVETRNVKLIKRHM